MYNAKLEGDGDGGDGGVQLSALTLEDKQKLLGDLEHMMKRC